VFQAIERGDSARAAALMKRHIESAKEFVLSRLKRSNDVFSNLMMGFRPQDMNPIYNDKTSRLVGFEGPWSVG